MHADISVDAAANRVLTLRRMRVLLRTNLTQRRKDSWIFYTPPRPGPARPRAIITGWPRMRRRQELRTRQSSARHLRQQRKNPSSGEDNRHEIRSTLAGDLIFDPKSAGTVYGLVVLGGNSFGFLAPIGTGFIISMTHAYTLSFIIAVALLLAAAVISWAMVRHPLQPPVRQQFGAPA